MAPQRVLACFWLLLTYMFNVCVRPVTWTVHSMIVVEEDEKQAKVSCTPIYDIYVQIRAMPVCLQLSRSRSCTYTYVPQNEARSKHI